MELWQLRERSWAVLEAIGRDIERSQEQVHMNVQGRVHIHVNENVQVNIMPNVSAIQVYV